MTNLAYVRRWFLTSHLFCRQIGAGSDLVERLVAAGAMPGPIYAEQDGVWWSALEVAEVPPAGNLWYAPAAIWWGRRALLWLNRGTSVEEAAMRNRAHFTTTFIEALAAEPLAALAFPDAFSSRSVDPEGATRCAEAEWASWADGGYAVCLRRFSGESCVRKESFVRHIRHHMEKVPGYRLDDDALFDLVERLESLMLPFAPWQRRTGSPGRAVDAPLAAMGLGAEMPYDIDGL